VSALSVYFNCDEMIDRAVYGDRMDARNWSVQRSDEMECPKACLLYFFFTKRVLL